MGRLFDSNASAVKAAEARENKESVRRRAEEIDKLLREELELNEETSKLEVRLQSRPMGVQAVVYKDFRLPGSKWMIEHAIVGDDYVYQMFPLRPIQADWRDTVVLLIAAMDAVFPRSIKIQYSPPNERYQVKYFTIRAEKVVGQPGWEEACEKRALKSLAGVPAWG
jgi:hypothetical protein